MEDTFLKGFLPNQNFLQANGPALLSLCHYLFSAVLFLEVIPIFSKL